MVNLSENIIPVAIEEEMRKSYIDYSMSVIVARALPDVRDGLKPVHRRVLFGMLDLGLRPTSAYKKSARIVGEVLGKYHPHGDSAVYDAMVRMVQDFSLRYPLVDGQGNFGSVDGDSAAAMRYTEARLAKITEEVIRDLEKDTVDFVPNFDDSLKEPSVLPSLLPTLLLNGAAGIAVGMATNIPPHNLSEIVDALAALISNPKIKPEKFLSYIKGPDFPTGATIFNEVGVKEYFKTGRGKITIKAKAYIEDMRGGRQRIVVTEIPYQVNKGSLLEKTADLVRNKKIDGISEIRDESDREGMRVVYELRKEVNAEKVLQALYKHTQLQTTFGVILLALVNGQPKVFNIKEMLQEFLNFRHDVILRRTKFELKKAEQRAHVLEGLKKALDNIDAIITIIKKSKNVDAAKKSLMRTFKFSDIQAQAILDMRLQRLTGLERKKIEMEYLELIKLIEKLRSLLDSKARRMQMVKTELLELKQKYGDARKTHIFGKTGNQSMAEMMKGDEFVVTLTHNGIINRYGVPQQEEKLVLSSLAPANDYIQYVDVALTIHRLYFFTNMGRCFALRTSFVPMVNNEENGTPLARLVPLKDKEIVVFFTKIDKFEEGMFVAFATQNGLVKRIPHSALSNISREGSVVLGNKDSDLVVSVEITNGEQDLFIASSNGYVIRFAESDVRDMGLQAGGVKGMEITTGEKVVKMIAIKGVNSSVLTFTTLGFGKRSELKEYSRIRRGGKGIINFKLSPKSGLVASVLEIQQNEMLLVATKKGKTKRVKAKTIKLMGRATQGTASIKVAQKDELDQSIYLPEVKAKN